MELDRQHRRAPSTTSDLFICFSSRLSKSSAMRHSSKSMVSPGRTDSNNKPSLSASLSRKLSRKNGSLRGGQSPMFPPGVNMSKKRGCAIENAEPSSPKVTCIGQVRVKTKKHGKKMKNNMKKAYRARRSGSGGGKDVSFRRNEGEGCLQHRNQRWVHIPMTICDALRAFGSELNCFSNCWPSSSTCFSRSKVSKTRNCSSCCCCGGGSLCRWLLCMHEKGGKRRDIELVMGEEKQKDEVREDKGRLDRVIMERECSRRRSIFDDMDFSAVDEVCEEKNEIEEVEVEEEAARVSICVPPKNALLLMRCRSDPVKMAALAHKFWESPKKDFEEEDCCEEIQTGRRKSFSEAMKIEDLSDFAKNADFRKRLSMEKKEEMLQSTEKQSEAFSEVKQQSAGIELIKEEKQHRVSIDCREHLWIYEDEDESLGITEDMEKKEATEVAPPDPAPSMQHQPEEKEDQSEIQQTEEQEEEIQLPSLEEDSIPAAKTQNRSAETREGDEEDDPMEEESSALPDCLLLMMCEPKLSMEVSKETWVCSTDFLRCLPERHRQHHLKKIIPDETVKNKKKKNKAGTNNTDLPNPAPLPRPPPSKLKPPTPHGLQPARSSCSFPIGGRVSGVAKEKKQANGAANSEPSVLTRCKSAPMRTQPAKLSAPELACSWKNRKIEPHRPATCGIGAAGVEC